jgi:hypothetical protein
MRPRLTHGSVLEMSLIGSNSTVIFPHIDETKHSVLNNAAYSKQANQKMLQVSEAHPDRNAQFEFINNKARQFIKAGEPGLSHTRMLSSVFIMQAAEALLLNSWAIAILLVIFFIGNMLYFPLVEEKALEKRFGEAYREYRRNVLRWTPRLRPWRTTQSR